MTEKEKMLAGELYNHYDPELTADRAYAAKLLQQFNENDNESRRLEMLKDMFGKLGANTEVKRPFLYDYGYNIELGDNVFINYNCTLLDCNKIIVGDNTLIAPNVQIYTATHPTDYKLRLKKHEYAESIVIGKNVWIGGGTVICPGVTIGNNTTIGAGSVVTKDIPDNCVAAGNPCRVIKKINEGEQDNG